MKKKNSIFSIKGKTVIITGSNSGIGFVLAKDIKKMGAKIIRIDKRFDKNLKTDDYICDIQNKETVNEIFKKIKKKYKKIDGFVNCIGISISNSKSFRNIKVFDETLNVNLRGAFILLSECTKILKKNIGSAINLTSIGAEQSFPHNPSYQASKAGLKQLTKSFARDFAYLGLRFNNICPGYIKKKMTLASYEHTKKKMIRSKRMILPRWGEAADIVGPVVFLLSNASSYITGSDIYVDGGWTSKGI